MSSEIWFHVGTLNFGYTNYKRNINSTWILIRYFQITNVAIDWVSYTLKLPFGSSLPNQSIKLVKLKNFQTWDFPKKNNWSNPAKTLPEHSGCSMDERWPCEASSRLRHDSAAPCGGAAPCRQLVVGERSVQCLCLEDGPSFPMWWLYVLERNICIYAYQPKLMLNSLNKLWPHKMEDSRNHTCVLEFGNLGQASISGCYSIITIASNYCWVDIMFRGCSFLSGKLNIS